MASKRQAPDGSFPDSASSVAGRYAHIGRPVDNGGQFSWADVDATLLAYAIRVVTDNGDAISFAVNRNRTGGSITILAGVDRVKAYCTDKISAQALLTQIIQGT